MTARPLLLAATTAAMAAAATLAACGANGRQSGGEINTFDVEEPAKAATDDGGPQIAYSYGTEYSLPPAAVRRIQARHVADCRAMGRARCLVLETTYHGGDDSGTGTDRGSRAGDAATTRLIVDARAAAAFGQRLDEGVRRAGGALRARTVTAEDVTRRIVDVEARLRAKQALAARLLRLIARPNATAGDLVAAEKAYADVQEELDAAHTLQRQLRQRVAMSEVRLTYNPARARGVWAPVATAMDHGAETFAASAGAAITFLIAAAPWLVIAGPLSWLLRRGWRRWRARRRGAQA